MPFGKFRILGKLALLVLIPLLGVVALSTPIMVSRINDARDAQSTSDRVRLATRASTAVQELQEERLLSVGFLFGLVEQPELVVQTALATDAVARVGDGGQPLSRELRRALHNASKLDNSRQNVINHAIRPDTLVADFTAVIAPIIGGLALSVSADLKTGVGRQLFALEQTLRTDDMMSQASGYLTVATITRDSGFISLFNTTLVQLRQVIANSRAFFTDAQYKLHLGAQDAFAARVGPDFLALAAIDPNAAVLQLDVRTLFPSLRSVLVLGGFVEKRVAADVDAIVTNNRDTALRDAFLIGGGSLLLLLVVITLSVLMARAVALPLRRLTASADRIARAAEAELKRVADDDAESVRPIRLDPVDVEARDEIGDLARAFGRVQDTAVRLVERQVLGRRNVAKMFAHVGRRTQNLVGRQLALIDTLERKETDSARLGELYRLDHMSSRLRRNASSLVVLSGEAGEHEHMAPLPLSDVVRLALGEIEDYTRVDMDVAEEIVVAPAVLADLTLLLAELMENAASFSPPHTRVTVTAAELCDGCRVAVIDHGLGMTHERLIEENSRLTRRERLDLAPSEVLGLFVVGRLARRHGIEVALTATPGGGVTVWVDLNQAHLIARVRSSRSPSFPAVPVSETAIHHTAEFTHVIAGSTVQASAPASPLQFDPHTLERATRALESAHSWNAFTLARRAEATPAIHAGPACDARPVYDAEPVYSPGAIYQEPVPAQPAFDLRAPLSDRFPASLPEFPAAGRSAWTRQPVASQPPLARRVPGATLPRNEPHSPRPSASARPLDPDAARASIEEFEYGVALALNEIQPQPEGQSR